MKERHKEDEKWSLNLLPLQFGGREPPHFFGRAIASAGLIPNAGRADL